jgi:hypothetical protein
MIGGLILFNACILQKKLFNALLMGVQYVSLDSKSKIRPNNFVFWDSAYRYIIKVQKRKIVKL